MKILVGDDSVLARKQLKDIIAPIVPDVTFIDASNGQEAIDLYKKESPKMAFLDIVMPVKDGVSSAKEIFSIDKDALIIIVSSVGTQNELKEALEAGAKDFVQKPVNPEIIKKIIENHLGV